jgi:hypothetical protein
VNMVNDGRRRHADGTSLCGEYPDEDYEEEEQDIRDAQGIPTALYIRNLHQAGEWSFHIHNNRKTVQHSRTQLQQLDCYIFSKANLTPIPMLQVSPTWSVRFDTKQGDR